MLEAPCVLWSPLHQPSARDALDPVGLVRVAVLTRVQGDAFRFQSTHRMSDQNSTSAHGQSVNPASFTAMTRPWPRRHSASKPLSDGRRQYEHRLAGPARVFILLPRRPSHGLTPFTSAPVSVLAHEVHVGVEVVRRLAEPRLLHQPHHGRHVRRGHVVATSVGEVGGQKRAMRSKLFSGVP